MMGNVLAGSGVDTAAMVVVHNVFRRVVGDLPYLIGGVAAGDTDRVAIVIRAFDEITERMRIHHRVEDDVLRPLLREHLDDNHNDTVEDSADEHRDLDDLVDRARHLAARWNADPSSARGAQFAAAVTELHTALVEHLSHEEAYVLPLVEARLRASEWQRFVDAERQAQPAARRLVFFGWLTDGLDPATRADFVAGLPHRERLRWRLVGRRRWRADRDRLFDL